MLKHPNLRLKISTSVILFAVLHLTLYALHLPYAYATNMESPNYRIQFGDINIGAKDQSSAGYNLSTTIGQLAAGQFQSQGFIVKAGFQYIHSVIPFRFSISQRNINFGTINPNLPKTVKTDLTVYFGGAGQYQVTALEEGPLRTISGNMIPDAVCNGGKNRCSEGQAALWSSSSAYGFGYNMAGQDIPQDFINSSYFRPFPDRESQESPAIIMSSPNVGKSRQSTATFKVNISKNQPIGTYQTVINFVATPSF